MSQKPDLELSALSLKNDKGVDKISTEGISSSAVPDTVYPEILIAVDYETFK